MEAQPVDNIWNSPGRRIHQKEVSEIIDALTRAGLVETQEVEPYKPVVALTDVGWRWLRSQEPAELILDLAR